jgi:Pyruvate/2-oxoacid:ferredoxin oxidoreductase gamma subunit/C-terminal processing protease CtpA/Prc
MAEEMIVKELDQVVVRFSGDSGDGMQLAGNLFSTISATVGNDISTFPDYPADIRAPQGSLTGVSGFQVHIGAEKVFTPGDACDVLVAMNAAALKTQYKFAKPTACIIIDTDCFQKSDLEKAAFKTDNPIEEMGIKNDVIAAPISQMVKDCLADSGMDNKSMLKCRNMFALGLVCWLFNRDLTIAENFLREKFAKKPAIAEANIKVIHAGYDYGHNTHSSVAHTYRIESKTVNPGKYMDITGNKATAYGFIAAAEKAGLKRGDCVIKYNGSEVTTSNYGNVWNQLFYGAPASATIVKRTAFSDATSTVTVNSGSYYPNPVAVYKVLDLKNYPDFADKKVGYLAYMGFEWEYRQELVDAFNYFKSQGITDLIIDLTPNGGGEVYTSNYLVSMILGEEYVGEFLGEMRRHPKNPEGNTMMYVTSQTDDQPTIHLPHLGLKKVYFLTTTNTASASEATIAGCMGLDVDVVVVGEEFTHGKNCGMDTETLKLGNGWYHFAPITFRIYNAKGWNDYADGIATDLNIKTFYDPAAFDNKTYTTKDIVFYYFPLPLDDWDNFFYNGPLQAALADMIGKSAKTDDVFGMNSAGGSGVSNSTRSSASQFGTIMQPVIDRQKDMRGMYVDKESIEAHREQQNN